MKTNDTNRISALKRLSKPTHINNNNKIQHRVNAPKTPFVTDARQLLTNRNKPIFDARQLLSRQSSKTLHNSVTTRNDIVQIEEEEEEEQQQDDNQKPLVFTRLADGRLTSGILDRSFERKNTNSISTEPISFTKTITNTSHYHEDDDRHSQTIDTLSSSSDKKVIISFANDQYRKRPRSPSPSPIIKRLHDASIQTTHLSSSSRSPIRTNSQRRHSNERDNHHESSIKRHSSRYKTTTTPLKDSLKRTSIDVPSNTRSKQISSTQLNSDNSTILITNLQSSVTEDDIIELFSEVGHIVDIKTLSRGCIQIIYSQPEHAAQAVNTYHNQLLDGQLMYVSLQQPTSSTKSSKHSKPTTIKENRTSNNSSISTNDNNESLKLNSNKIIIDPTFIRQALFNPSSNTTNPIQFQVKL